MSHIPALPMPQPWTNDAVCATIDPDLWFPVTKSRARYAQQVNTARTICGTCPVATQCLAEALADPHLEGIWGGTTQDERRRLRRTAAA